MSRNRQDADPVAASPLVGIYRANRKGFGFVKINEVPGGAGQDASVEKFDSDVFIPPGEARDALSGDTVKVMITERGQREGKSSYTGRIQGVLKRGQSKFVGTLVRQGTDWLVNPDGEVLTQPIETPDAATRHLTPGLKVAVEIIEYPKYNRPARGVIVQVLGESGDKDVDLQTVIIEHNLPGEFPEAVIDGARDAIARFDPEIERTKRLDLSDEIVLTIDPDDAKDYDDAISLTRTEGGGWELGVHIADVSFFVRPGTALDDEARTRGNSCYFPGKVIPMLPEVLSNGVCSLQEAVPRCTMTAFIQYDRDARVLGTRFDRTLITSAKRLRYREAQALIDGEAVIPHPEGDRKRTDYAPHILKLLADMDELSKRIQKRRVAAGQLSLNLPEVELVLDERGRVCDTKEEDQSFTHTLIEMFMVEANEAVARLLDSLEWPFLRRTHPDPNLEVASKLRDFASGTGHKLPKVIDRFVMQALLKAVKGRPEEAAINTAVLRSMSRAEYSPKVIGHFALASTHYTHFTSPIRRYTDLTIHRLLEYYFELREDQAEGRETGAGKSIRKLGRQVTQQIPTYDDLIELGRNLSVTERRAEAAERQLRLMKVLHLLKDHIGEEFPAVVTGMTQFGMFIQIQKYLVDGLAKFEDLGRDRWIVDERTGTVKGQRTGKRVGVGDRCTVRIVRVDDIRRQLDLVIVAFGTRARTDGKPAEDDADTTASEPARTKHGRHEKAGRDKGDRGKRGRSEPWHDDSRKGKAGKEDSGAGKYGDPLPTVLAPTAEPTPTIAEPDDDEPRKSRKPARPSHLPPEKVRVGEIELDDGEFVTTGRSQRPGHIPASPLPPPPGNNMGDNFTFNDERVDASDDLPSPGMGRGKPRSGVPAVSGFSLTGKGAHKGGKKPTGGGGGGGKPPINKFTRSSGGGGGRRRRGQRGQRGRLRPQRPE